MLNQLLRSLSVIFICFSFTQLTAQPLYQTDFSNPAAFTMSSSDPAIDWTIGTAGPAGVQSQNMGIIASNSVGNFALLDLDVSGFSGVVTADLQVDSTFDFSPDTLVEVCFLSYFKEGGTGDCEFQVSTDMGTTWTSFPVHDALAALDSTANPDTVIIDVSPVAAGQAFVSFRWQYTQSSNPGFAWMIDDFCISNSAIILAVDQNAIVQIHVFPNPVVDILHIDLSEYKEIREIEILDATGRSMRKTHVLDEKLEIDLSEMPAGNYLLLMKSDGAVRTTTIVKR